MCFPLFFLYFFQYADGGVYVIKVTINDGEGGVATTTSMITGVMLIDGVLQIVGTDDDDHVTINKVGKSKLRVHADFLPGRKTFVDFRLSDVTRIDVWLCDGDDHYNGGGDCTSGSRRNSTSAERSRRTRFQSGEASFSAAAAAAERWAIVRASA